GWVYLDVRDRDLSAYIQDADKLLARKLNVPTGYSLAWAGEYESMKRANQRMMLIIPTTLLSILFLLYAIFRRWMEPLLILITLPFSLIGGFWLVYLMSFNLSIAVDVGFIALAGIATEFGVVLLLYLNMAIQQREETKGIKSVYDLMDAIIEGS